MAIAASRAFPPSRKICKPIPAATGSDDTTIPFRATVGLGEAAGDKLKVTVIKQTIIVKIRERFMLPPLYALIFGIYITITKWFMQELLR
jgi:hypothetical protein